MEKALAVEFEHSAAGTADGRLPPSASSEHNRITRTLVGNAPDGFQPNCFDNKDHRQRFSKPPPNTMDGAYD
jgi:hypothetical protein